MGEDNVLKPTKFKPSDKVKPDEFGQSYNSDTDPSKISELTAAQVRKFHLRDDVDNSPRAHHHTLGTGHNQASPGDHNHTGFNSKKIGPLEMDSGSPGNTRAQWTLPVSPTGAQIATFLTQFVNVRLV